MNRGSLIYYVFQSYVGGKKVAPLKKSNNQSTKISTKQLAGQKKKNQLLLLFSLRLELITLSFGLSWNRKMSDLHL